MKSNTKTLISFITFIISLFTSYFLGEIFYNSIDGTDFYRYFRYIEYFNGTVETPSREQGLFYFWFISNFIEFSQNYYLPDKWEYVYSTAIQFGNFLLYLVGLLGLFLWLASKKINKSVIFLSFSVLNFFPPVYGGRLIMKPEIIVFCFLPWVFIGIDNYFNNQKKLNLILVAPLLSLLVTSKGTIAIMVFLSLLYLYFEDIKKINIKNLLVPVGIFTVLTTLLYNENSNINSVSLLSHQELDQYLFKAQVSFLYNINFVELFTNPFRSQHADSLIGITLIDLFGDYFNRYWDHSRSLFLANRRELFEFLPNPRRNISLLLSTIFVISSIFSGSNKTFKKHRMVYLIGTLILALTSLGLFGLHFNPEKGDTVKTHYYFYLIAISFTVIFVQYLSNRKYLIQLVSVFLTIIISLFIFGFPKTYDSEYESIMQDKLAVTIGCNISSLYYDNYFSDETKCLNKKIATCGFYEEYAKPENHPDGYLIFQNDDFFNPINLIDTSGYTVTVNGYAECLNYAEGGYYRNINNIFNENRTPLINNVVMLLSFISVIGFTVLAKKDN